MTDQPSTFAFVLGYWIPEAVQTVSDSDESTSSRLVAAGALGLGAYAFYYMVGNPIDAVQNGEFVDLGVGYAAGTVVGYATFFAAQMGSM